MLHHHYGIADIAQPPEHLDQPGGIPRMQADTGLVQYVQGTHQGASQSRHQANPLAFTAGERVAGPAERQVRQAHIAEVLQARHHFLHGLPRNGPFGIGQLYRGEEFQQGVDIHIQQFTQVPAAHLHVQGLRAQPRSMAGMAGCPAGEAAQHIFILDFVSVRFHPLEELGHAHQGILVPLHAAGVPDGVPLLLCEVAVRLEGADAVFRRQTDHMVAEPAHLLSPPAGNGAVVQALGFVGHHQILAHADDFPQAAAHRAGTQRAVETEEVFIGLFERHPVHLHAVHKGETAALPFPLHIDLSVPAGIGIGHRGQHAGAQIVPFLAFPPLRYADTVDQQGNPGRIIAGFGPLHHFLDAKRTGRSHQTGIALLFQGEHEFHLVGPVVPVQVGQQVGRSVRGVGAQ